jgi:hypothetical protein
MELCRESLELCRRQRARLGDTPKALLDLYMSLKKLSDVEYERGNFAAFEAAQREGRELIALLGLRRAKPPPAPEIGQSP